MSQGKAGREEPEWHNTHTIEYGQAEKKKETNLGNIILSHKSPSTLQFCFYEVKGNCENRK